MRERLIKYDAPSFRNLFCDRNGRHDLLQHERAPVARIFVFSYHDHIAFYRKEQRLKDIKIPENKPSRKPDGGSVFPLQQGIRMREYYTLAFTALDFLSSEIYAIDNCKFVEGFL